MQTEDRIIQEVDLIHEKTKGHNGVLVYRLMGILKFTLEELKPYLRKLQKEKKIIIRDGIHGFMVFKNLKNK